MLPSETMFQTEVATSAVNAERNANRQNTHDNRNLIDEVMDHSKRSWNHVLQGHSTLSEKAEVGTEAVVATAATAAAAFALSKCLPAIEKIFPEASSSLKKEDWITPQEAWKDLY